MERINEYALRILSELGVEDIPLSSCHNINSAETETASIGPARVSAKVVDFGGTCRVDIDFRLPENGAVARTFIEYCAGKEGTPKNRSGQYACGPTYKDWTAESRGKHTSVITNWDHFFYIRSENYGAGEVEEAVTNAIALAKQFSDHLGEYDSLRVWTTEDAEVTAKAMEITAHADLRETDIEHEYGGHWIQDRNSFMKGWFYPFNDRGRGTFDTVWPGSVDHVASHIGHKGSFEYAVASVLLTDPDFIAKARKACVIRTETITRRY